MATKAPLRLAALSLRPPRPLHHSAATTAKRTFLSSLLAKNDKPIHLHVSRTLPYPRAQLYDLIADVDSYSKFLPYCKHSRVTAWTTTITTTSQQEEGGHATAASGSIPHRLPSAGELSLGLGPINQTYTSRIVCVPGHSVEAHSGDDEPLVRQADKQRGYQNPFKKLSTRWTLRDGAETASTATASTTTRSSNGHTEKTLVDLDISMTLHDSMMQAVLSQMLDGTAEEMIKAFEKRAAELFGRK